MKEEDIAFVDWIDICEILFIYLFSFFVVFSCYYYYLLGYITCDYHFLFINYV